MIDSAPPAREIYFSSLSCERVCVRDVMPRVRRLRATRVGAGRWNTSHERVKIAPLKSIATSRSSNSTARCLSGAATAHARAHAPPRRKQTPLHVPVKHAAPSGRRPKGPTPPRFARTPLIVCSALPVSPANFRTSSNAHAAETAPRTPSPQQNHVASQRRALAVNIGCPLARTPTPEDAQRRTTQRTKRTELSKLGESTWRQRVGQKSHLSFQDSRRKRWGIWPTFVVHLDSPSAGLVKPGQAWSSRLSVIRQQTGGSGSKPAIAGRFDGVRVASTPLTACNATEEPRAQQANQLRPQCNKVEAEGGPEVPSCLKEQ